jgi:hypothetical protein
MEVKFIFTWRSSRNSTTPKWHPSFVVSTLEIGKGNRSGSTMAGTKEDNIADLLPLKI